MALKVLYDLASVHLFPANSPHMLSIQGYLQFWEHAIHICASVSLLMLFPLLKMSLLIAYPSLLLLSAAIMTLLHSLGPNSIAFSFRLCCLPRVNNCTICCSSAVIRSCSMYHIIPNCTYIEHTLLDCELLGLYISFSHVLWSVSYVF